MMFVQSYSATVRLNHAALSLLKWLGGNVENSLSSIFLVVVQANIFSLYEIVFLKSRSARVNQAPHAGRRGEIA
jgi:hypothetical protein